MSAVRARTYTTLKAVAKATTEAASQVAAKAVAEVGRFKGLAPSSARESKTFRIFVQDINHRPMPFGKKRR